MKKPLELGLGTGDFQLPEDFYSKLAENANAGPITCAFAALFDRAEEATRQLERKAKTETVKERN